MQINVSWALSRRNPVSERSLRQATNGYAEFASVNCRGMGAQACRHCQHTTKGTEVSMGFQLSEPSKNDGWRPDLAQRRSRHTQPAKGSQDHLYAELTGTCETRRVTTSQVAAMLEVSYHGARKLLITLEQAGTPPITCLDGRWVTLACYLRAAHRPRGKGTDH
jgi:hypothetical protein